MRTDIQRSVDSNEMSILELVKVLWQSKFLISVVALLFALAAVLYAYTVPSVYRASVFVEPPLQNDIAPLNLGRGDAAGLTKVTPKSAFEAYARSLQSESLRREFFEKKYVPSLKGEDGQSQDSLYLNFNKSLVVVPVVGEGDNRYSISITSLDPRQAVSWVEEYADLASLHARDLLVKDLQNDIVVRVQNIQLQIDTLRGNAEKQRGDEISQLSDALSIAKSLGIKNPTQVAKAKAGDVSLLAESSLAYMRGSRALQAEIDVLKSRETNDPYIEGLRVKQAELEFYRELKLTPDLVALYRKDGGVQLPDKPVKPNKSFIILIGGLLGLVVGVIIVFFRRIL